MSSWHKIFSSQIYFLNLWSYLQTFALLSSGLTSGLWLLSSGAFPGLILLHPSLWFQQFCYTSWCPHSFVSPQLFHLHLWHSVTLATIPHIIYNTASTRLHWFHLCFTVLISATTPRLPLSSSALLLSPDLCYSQVVHIYAHTMSSVSLLCSAASPSSHHHPKSLELLPPPLLCPPYHLDWHSAPSSMSDWGQSVFKYPADVETHRSLWWYYLFLQLSEHSCMTPWSSCSNSSASPIQLQRFYRLDFHSLVHFTPLCVGLCLSSFIRSSVSFLLTVTYFICY